MFYDYKKVHNSELFITRFIRTVYAVEGNEKFISSERKSIDFRILSKLKIIFIHLMSSFWVEFTVDVNQS